MFNLLSAGFYRIRKNRLLWSCVLIMAVWSVILCVGYWKNFVADYDGGLDEVSFMDSLFPTLSLVIMVFAVLVSIFLGTEYSDGTIRNKVTAGHTRGSIYLSQFIVSTAACLTVYLLSLGVSALLGFLLLGGTDMPSTKILIYCGTGVLMCVVDAAVFTLITMTAGNKAAGAVICLLASFFLAAGAGTVYGPLSQEEYFYQPRAVYEAMQGNNGTEVVVMGGDTEMEEENGMVKIPNPLYISGQKRKIFEFLLDCNPVGQAVQLSELELERPINVAVYDLTEIVICCAAGMLLFCKKDLK